MTAAHQAIIQAVVQILHPGCRTVAISETTLDPQTQRRLNLHALRRDIYRGRLSAIPFHLRGYARSFGEPSKTQSGAARAPAEETTGAVV